MYNFLFDRRSLTLLVGGLAVAGGLVFFAGVLVGVNWIVPFSTAHVAALPARAQDCPPSALAAAPKPAPAPVPAALPEPPAPALEEAEEAEPEPAPEPEPAVAEPPAPEPAPLPPAPRAVAAATVAASPAASEEETGGYAVQVGAFSKPENSEAVVRDLESRGYDPYVVPLQGSRRRVLHAVRIGRFEDRVAAARAASDFRQKEKMTAIVLRSGSL